MNRRQGIIASIFFLAYILLGGLVFMVIENDFEPEQHPSKSGITDGYLHTLQSIQNEYLNQNPLNLTEEELEGVRKHVEFVYQILVERGTTNANSSIPTSTQVTYDDAIFFCLIMITTIGYGNTTPKTSGGRLFCVFYALAGIPMTGILLAALGNYFSSKLLKAHEKSKTRHYNSRIALIVNTILYLIPGFLFCIFLPAGIFTLLEDWTFIDGLYYSFITLFTIGFGDFVAGSASDEHRWLYKACLMIWIIFGMGYLSMILNFIAKAMKSKKLRSLEKSVANSLKQTQERVNKEMEYFLKAMNAFYSRKIKAKGDPTDLHRSSSCPSLSGMTEEEVDAEMSKRTYSAKEAEDSANFILNLAMALGCGPNAEDGNTMADNDNNNNSSINQLPSLDRRRSSLPQNLERRRSSLAQQLLSLALMPQINRDSVPSKSEMGLQEVLAHFDAIRAPSFVLPFGDVVETDNETLSDDVDDTSVYDDGHHTKDHNNPIPNGNVVKDSSKQCYSPRTCSPIPDSIIDMLDEPAENQEDETEVSKL